MDSGAGCSMKVVVYRQAEIEQQGAAAFRDGVPRDRNPYNQVAHSRHGPMKAAWWSAGWIKAQQSVLTVRNGERKI